MASSSEPLQGAAAAVLQRSDALPAETPQIRGYDFNEGVDYNKLLEAMLTTGKLRSRPTRGAMCGPSFDTGLNSPNTLTSDSFPWAPRQVSRRPTSGRQ